MVAACDAGREGQGQEVAPAPPPASGTRAKKAMADECPSEPPTSIDNSDPQSKHSYDMNHASKLSIGAWDNHGEHDAGTHLLTH